MTRPMTKKELRLLMNISQRTLSTWLNERYFHLLEPLGYQRTQKILTGAQVSQLDKQLDILER